MGDYNSMTHIAGAGGKVAAVDESVVTAGVAARLSQAIAGTLHPQHAALTEPIARVGRRWIGIGIAGMLCMAAAVPVAHAQQADQSAIDRQNQLNVQQNLNRAREEQERALRQQRTESKGVDLNGVQSKISVPAMAACRDIRTLRIHGADLLSDAERAALQQRYTGRCLGVGDLEALLGALTRYYIDRGYITTRAYLPAQDLRSGILEVTVVEGRIERYKVKETGRPDARINTATAFPTGAGRRLNLRDLEQGIEQLNSVPSNAATLALEPGAQPGQSVVVVDNRATFPLHAFATWDNLGVPSTGREAASATVSEGGVLGFNEVVSLTQRQTAPADPAHKSAVSALLVAVPFGYTTFSYNASVSTYRNVLQLPSGNTLTSKGNTGTQTLAIDRVFYRGRATRLSASAGLTRQDSQNFLGGEYLDVASRVLTTLDLGVSGFTQVGGGVLNGHVGYVKGLKSLGALHDIPEALHIDPHAQFGKYVLDLGYSKQFERDGVRYAWSTRFSGQYSSDTLYGSQQILIGGPSTVRGPLADNLAGDYGYYLRNEASQFWNASMGSAPVAGRVYLGFDFGSVHNHAPGVPSGSLSGMTVGLDAQWRFLSATAFVSHTLSKPATFPADPTLLGVRLSASF